ncbi:MAG: RNA-directed DNA polymerase, partial [Sulfurovaceae bacterium]|nr:RNA-directed DNA polymerase [Sulfurovaceae bacterium]
YERFKELILYYCSISSFSIRKPHRIAKFTFFKDKAHYDNLSGESFKVEEHDKEYENLRSFFVYKDYNNVYKFYESYKFHRCEKRYNNLLKLDISKCFDSIYTHSLSWALLNKESVKENIDASKRTFAGLFDELMQKLNYNETNGIIIGPEFSRIFAEMILQSVDYDLEFTLNNKYKIKHKVHYEIFRYVDDYFIFYNDNNTKDSILENLQLHLKNYKLYLNVNKQVVYEKPIITEITIAKQRVKDLFNEYLVFELIEIANEDKQFSGFIKIRSNSLITKFKTIIKECNVEYRDMLNYALSIVEGNSEKILKKYDRSDKNQAQIINAIREIIDFVFFIYSVSPRVNTTIKLCRISSVFIYFIRQEKINSDHKDTIFKSIFDNICFIINKNKHNENTQVETLYLLLALSELGKDYWLELSVLLDYFGISEDSNGELSTLKSFNYFSLMTFVFYMKGKSRYSKLRSFIECRILEKFEINEKLLRKDTELTLLLMDSLSCPYICNELKYKLLNIYSVTDEGLQNEVINKRDQWFTSWKNFDFRKELDAKRSKEVY